MQVSKEDLLHIANLARLEIKEDELEEYLKNLENILEFSNIINNAHTDDLDITIRANEAMNVFRKDEVKVYEDNEALLRNAPSKENNMYKIPKVL